MSPVRIFCPSCSAFHEGEVALDATAWSSVKWVEPHDPDAVALRDHLDAIADEATAAFATAMSRGHFDIAGVFAAEVLGDDGEEDRS